MTVYVVLSEPFDTLSTQWINGKIQFFQPPNLTIRIRVDAAPNGLDVNLYDVSGGSPSLLASANISGPGPSVDIPFGLGSGSYRIEVSSSGGQISGHVQVRSDVPPLGVDVEPEKPQEFEQLQWRLRLPGYDPDRAGQAEPTTT